MSVPKSKSVAGKKGDPTVDDLCKLHAGIVTRATSPSFQPTSSMG